MGPVAPTGLHRALPILRGSLRTPPSSALSFRPLFCRSAIVEPFRPTVKDSSVQCRVKRVRHVDEKFQGQTRPLASPSLRKFQTGLLLPRVPLFDTDPGTANSAEDIQFETTAPVARCEYPLRRMYIVREYSSRRMYIVREYSSRRMYSDVHDWENRRILWSEFW